MRAKLWWLAMPFYWGGMLASLRIEAASTFYHSAAAGIANVFFFPPLVVFILSFGYIKARVALLDLEDDAGPEAYFEWRRKRYGPSCTLREFDPLDPASGALWVGNSINPLNGAYINRRPS